MRWPRSALAGFCLLVLAATVGRGAQEALPAFPGAEGFGAVATGGRGGQVIKVTSLKAKGPGSLNAAVQAKGPRIVVFDVAGTIEGDVTITQSDLTIAGQTAPPPGITIEGILKTRYRIEPPVANVILRFLRVRPPRRRGKWAGGDCLQITRVDRLIIDHVACSWGSDENMDLCGSSRATVQWCAIEEADTVGHSKGQHNYGMIIGYTDRGNVTIHHNLFAHCQKRAPLIGCETVDHRNNVLYNMLLPFIMHPVRMNRQRPGEPFRCNLVANLFKPGPNVKAHMQGRPFDKLVWNRPCMHLYAEGNVCTWLDGPATSKAEPLAAKPWPAPPVATHSAEEAYELVLAHAGCLPRDAVSRRTIDEVRTGTGSWGRREPARHPAETLLREPPPPDADADGMPDAWERAHHLDPNDAADATATVPAGASPDVALWADGLPREDVRLASGDFDGDGDPQLVVWDPGSGLHRIDTFPSGTQTPASLAAATITGANALAKAGV
ncbi:MAG: pectate lyase family protein [Planctomycetota bacterium]